MLELLPYAYWLDSDPGGGAVRSDVEMSKAGGIVELELALSRFVLARFPQQVQLLATFTDKTF